MGEGRWNPWRALRARPQIELEWRWLRNAKGMWVPGPEGTSTIMLDVRLSQRERRCVLAHELVHEERGIAYTSTCPAELVELEERIVDRITARRLVPPEQLLDLVARMDPEPVTVLDVAEEFDVDSDCARRACALLG